MGFGVAESVILLVVLGLFTLGVGAIVALVVFLSLSKSKSK